jgi:hypothetical protein
VYRDWISTGLAKSQIFENCFNSGAISHAPEYWIASRSPLTRCDAGRTPETANSRPALPEFRLWQGIAAQFCSSIWTDSMHTCMPGLGSIKPRKAFLGTELPFLPEQP